MTKSIHVGLLLMVGQLTYLCKKICENKDSANHQATVKPITEANRELLEVVILQAHSEEKVTTAEVFHAAYKFATH